MDGRLTWLWLSLACGQGSKTAINLLCAFGSPEKIYKADRKTLAQALPDGGMPLLNRLSNKDLSDAASILRYCDESGIRILTPTDAQYPRALYQLRDAPIVLYCVGNLPNWDTLFCCAVVGTRKMSEYGRRMAYDVGRGLGAGGALLVSGLALGVDGMSMAGALSSGGVTVGVLGCGIDIVYPPEHKELMKRVLADGAVITEYPPGSPPDRYHFPKRNRIISGICQAVVVVEGDMKSGSLITARHALYQGRDLYAVPGNIGESGAAGPNALIKNGARAITSAVDVLKNYEFLYPHTLRLAAAESALASPEFSGDAADVALKMNVVARDDKKYYGGGLYGGKSMPPKGKKSIPAKTMVKRFKENAPEKPGGTMVKADRVDFETLSEKEKNVYAALTPDVPTLADDIHVSGLSVADVLSSLTMLELAGAVECGAGGYYLRRSSEEDTEPIRE